MIRVTEYLDKQKTSSGPKKTQKKVKRSGETLSSNTTYSNFDEPVQLNVDISGRDKQWSHNVSQTNNVDATVQLRKNVNSDDHEEPKGKSDQLGTSPVDVIQGKFIHEKMKKVKLDGAKRNSKYSLAVKSDFEDEILDYPYLDYNMNKVVEDKKEAISFFQESISEIGKEAPHSSFSNDVEKTGTKSEGEHIEGEQGYKLPKSDDLWPFSVDIKADYNKTEAKDGKKETMSINAFYAKGKYGYITKVKDNDSNYLMEVKEPAKKRAKKPVKGKLSLFEEGSPKPYSSMHSTEESESLWNDSMKLKTKHDADALTKVTAESARWESVKTLADKKTLTDESKFYTSYKPDGTKYTDDEKPNYITFRNLWTQWKYWNNKWKITDGKLARALHKKLENKGNDTSLKDLMSSDKNLDVGKPSK